MTCNAGCGYGTIVRGRLLALVGDHGRGALTLTPATTPMTETGAIDLDALAAGAQAILREEGGALGDLLADLGGASGRVQPEVHPCR